MAWQLRSLDSGLMVFTLFKTSAAKVCCSARLALQDVKRDQQCYASPTRLWLGNASAQLNLNLTGVRVLFYLL